MSTASPRSNKQKRRELVARKRRRAERRERRLTPDPDEAEARRLSEQLAARRREVRDPRAAIARAFDGGLTCSPTLARLVRRARELGCAKGASQLLQALVGSRLLGRGTRLGEAFDDALLAIAFHRDRWLRSPSDWRPERGPRNRARQLSLLLRHLFAKYPTPALFDHAWSLPIDGPHWDEALVQQEWFVHVGGGGSWRTAPGLPVPLTRREAGLALRAPASLEPARALRWGQIRAAGGDTRLARALLASRMGNVLRAPGGEGGQAFWMSVVRWLVAHPMLDRRQVGPIVDFLTERRFHPVLQLDGTLRPTQPNLSMHRRDPVSLLRQVSAWHARLAERARWEENNWSQIDPTWRWPSCGVPGLRVGSGIVWEIVELRTAQDLGREGHAMRHCVYSYARSARDGECAIFSMRRRDSSGVARRLTIELEPCAGWMVVQARGKCNRDPDLTERQLLERWARETDGLRIASFLD